MVLRRMSMSYDLYKSGKEELDDKWDQTDEGARW